MWASTTKKNISRLQKVQNFAAQIETGTRKYDHITRCIQEILGIKISLIYHFLHQQQVSNLRTAQLWNTLPERLANIESFNVFKPSIKGCALDEFLSH